MKRGGKVHAKVITNAASTTLMLVMDKEGAPDSIVYTDYQDGYNAPDVSKFEHYMINHSLLFVDQGNHINGIERFWNWVKR